MREFVVLHGSLCKMLLNMMNRSQVECNSQVNRDFLGFLGMWHVGTSASITGNIYTAAVAQKHFHSCCVWLQNVVKAVCCVTWTVALWDVGVFGGVNRGSP